ncbi:MAG: HAMP domain-containing sensor histidine kinase [Elusimicrobiota bacterium]
MRKMDSEDKNNTDEKEDLKKTLAKDKIVEENQDLTCDVKQSTSVETTNEISILSNIFSNIAKNLIDAIQKSENKNIPLEEADRFKSEFLSDTMVQVADILEEKNTKLKETQEQLVQAEKMASIGIVTAGVVHDINNLLGSMLTNTQMLLMIEEDENKKESLNLMQRAIRQCKNMVKDLLDYARKETIVIDQKQINLNTSLEEACNLMQVEIEKDQIKLEKEFSENIPEVQANENELIQVFTNVLVNARKAIRKSERAVGERKIIIKTSQDSDHVIIDIIDNGCGIPDEIRGRIFDPFFTTEDAGKGTGLGLSITKTIIDRHKGIIECKSKLDEGTTMFIKLPKIAVIVC